MGAKKLRGVLRALRADSAVKVTCHRIGISALTSGVIRLHLFQLAEHETDGELHSQGFPLSTRSRFKDLNALQNS